MLEDLPHLAPLLRGQALLLPEEAEEGELGMRRRARALVAEVWSSFGWPPIVRRKCRYVQSPRAFWDEPKAGGLFNRSGSPFQRESRLPIGAWSVP